MSPDAGAELLGFLRSRLARPGLAFLRPPEPIGRGRSADTFAFAVDAPELPGALVARVGHDHGAARVEAAFQTRAAAAGFPTPSVLLRSEPSDGLRRPHTITALAPGRDPLAGGPHRALRAFASVPGLLADAMADLHAVDPAGLPDGDDVVEQLRSSPDTDVRSAAERLSATRPPATPAVLCHGDLHGLNLLLVDGRVSAVLDWELARLAPAGFDVARTELILCCVPGAPALLRPLGRRSARRFVDAYRARRPLSDQELDWYRLLHCARTLAIVRHGSAPPAVVATWSPHATVLARRCREGR